MPIKRKELGNSGNYVSLRTSYHFNNIETDKNKDLNQLLLIPTWGIKRNLGAHFNYELGGGLGLESIEGTIGSAFYLNLRIGYRF